MEIILISVTFIVLIALGIPIGTCLGIAAVITVFYFDLGIGMLGVNFASSIASFPLLAIPFFVLAGVILEKAGLAATIALFFELLVGRAVGGLAMVAVLTCMFWGALSGSGPATTAAVGLILLTPMLKHGYDKNFAGATIANSSDLSIIISPSIAFIIYGDITSVSVSALFLAGIIPGLLTGAGTILVAYLVSRKRGYRGLERRGGIKEILIAFKKSIWALFAPVIILGGIYAGIFTPIPRPRLWRFSTVSISYILMPILMPVLAAFGIDPLWYGVIFVSALAIGQATPPVGVNLFTAANLIKGNLDSIAKEAIAYVVMDVVVLIILSLFPLLSLYLPVKAGLYVP